MTNLVYGVVGLRRPQGITTFREDTVATSLWNYRYDLFPPNHMKPCAIYAIQSPDLSFRYTWVLGSRPLFYRGIGRR